MLRGCRQLCSITLVRVPVRALLVDYALLLRRRTAASEKNIRVCQLNPREMQKIITESGRHCEEGKLPTIRVYMSQIYREQYHKLHTQSSHPAHQIPAITKQVLCPLSSKLGTYHVSRALRGTPEL